MTISFIIFAIILSFCSAGLTQTAAQECDIIRGDGRDAPDNLNDNPGAALNMFTGIESSMSGRITNITFYAVRSGSPYISFWKATDMTRQYELVNKVKLNISYPLGLKTISLDYSFYWVPANVTLAVHYDDYFRYRGSIPYEREDRPPLTPNVTVYDVWSTSEFNDNGWSVGKTITFQSDHHLPYRKAVALHVEICSGCANCQNEQCDLDTGHCLSGCVNGYKPPECFYECDVGTYGQNCSYNCSNNCINGQCERTNGHCSQGCLPGYYYPQCNEACVSGRYGDNCTQTCPPNCHGDICNNGNGSCVNGCKEGFIESNFCQEECDAGTYGRHCENNCSTNCIDGQCDRVNGHCSQGCLPGHYFPLCVEECHAGTYGLNCENNCSQNCINGECHIANGQCTFGCLPGYYYPLCQEGCAPGLYGNNCAATCPPNCRDGICDNIDGRCVDGCKDGYVESDSCEYECVAGTYGRHCENNCSSNCINRQCDKVNGHCSQGCWPGYYYPLCNEECKDGSSGYNCQNKNEIKESSESHSTTLLICLSVFVTTTVISTTILAFLCIFRMRRDRGPQTPQTSTSPRFTEQHVYANEATAEIEMKPNKTSSPDFLAYETTVDRGSTYDQPDSFYEPLKIED